MERCPLAAVQSRNAAAAGVMSRRRGRTATSRNQQSSSRWEKGPRPPTSPLAIADRPLIRGLVSIPPADAVTVPATYRRSPQNRPFSPNATSSSMSWSFHPGRRLDRRWLSPSSNSPIHLPGASWVLSTKSHGSNAAPLKRRSLPRLGIACCLVESGARALAGFGGCSLRWLCNKIQPAV